MVVGGSTSSLLASSGGSSDCDIFIWDLITMTSVCKLRGHKDAVTGVVSFINLPSNNMSTSDTPSKYDIKIISVSQYSISKDTLLKVWDLFCQHSVVYR